MNQTLSRGRFVYLSLFDPYIKILIQFSKLIVVVDQYITKPLRLNVRIVS